jgi:protein-disulfide isomerase
MKRLYVVVGAAAVAIAAGLVIASQVGGGGGAKAKPAAAKAAGAAETAALLRGIPQAGNVLGRASAPVTLVEFADLQCPYCAQYAVDVMPSLVEEYVRTGKVKLEFHGLAFVGPDSETALRTVMSAASQNRMWHVLDLLYRNQGAENSGWVTEPLLRSIGESVPGLETAALLDSRSSAEVSNRIAADRSSADAAGINSTPTFAVGRSGGPMQILRVGALEPAAFRPALNSLLAG